MSMAIPHPPSLGPRCRHLPFGVLYDLLCAGDRSDLPWRIVVHFHAFPAGQVRCVSSPPSRPHQTHPCPRATPR
jgi:hypothetical protein